jgi:hypothetical protein
MAGTRVTSGTLVATTVADVTFATFYRWVKVTNRGTVDIFVRLDKVNPTVGGDDCDVVPAGTSVVFSNPQGYPDTNTGVTANTDVRLISSATPAYTVTGVN